MNKLPKCKGKYGYTQKEVHDICHKLKIDTRKFWVAFGINTCALVKGESQYYPVDIERTLYKLGHKLGVNHMWD